MSLDACLGRRAAPCGLEEIQLDAIDPTPSEDRATADAPLPPVSDTSSVSYRFRIDTDYSAEELSEGVGRLTGYTAADFTAGRIHWAGILHPDDLARVTETIGAAIRAHQPFQLEYLILHRDGSTRRVLQHGKLGDPAASPPVIEGFLTDRTAHQQAVEALAETTQRLEAHLESSPLGIVELDPELLIRRWSPAAERLFGFGADEVLGGTFLSAELVHEEDLRDVSRRLSQLLDRTRRRARIAFRARCNQGGGFSAESFGAAIYDARGRTKAICLQILDGSERERWARGLDESEQRLRWALVAGGGGAWDWDLRRGKAWFSPEMYQLWGIEPGTEIGRKYLAGLIHEEDRARLRTEMEAAIEGRGDCQCEFRIHNPRTGVRWMRAQGRVVLDETGDPERLVGLTFDTTDRELAAGELARVHRDADQRGAELEALLEAVPAAVWIAHDPECRHITGNRTADEWLRLPRGTEASLTADGPLRPAHFRVCKDGRELRGDELPVQMAARGVEVRDFEEEIRYADGSVRTLLGNAATLWDEQARPRGSVAAFIDITERKRIEDSLRDQVEINRSYLETVQSLMVALDVEGRITMLNRKGREILGYADDEILGRNWFDTCLPQPEGRERIYPMFRRIMADEFDAFEYFENAVRCRDGATRLIAWHNARLTDASGVTIGILSAGEDITDRRQMEEALLRSQADLNRAQAVGQIGSWRLDVRRNLLTWSPENYRIFGVSEGTPLTYEIFLSRVHPDDRDYVDSMWDRALRGEPYDIEHRLVADGKVKWVREIAELELDHEGSLLGGFGTTKDVTERKAIEEALRESIRRKDEFLATLAHELRNPLAPILNAAEVIRLKAPDDPTLRAAQQLIDRQLGNMSRLIDDLLDVSRITRGRLQLRRERVELGALLDQVIEDIQPRIEASGLALERLPVATPVYLSADPLRLVQVFQNLLDNACKYSRKGGTVRLGVERNGGEVAVRVADTGIGIAADQLPRVFEMFTQGDADAEQARGGLGIGLSLARALVQMHGGEIEARSDGPGLGSEFIVRLPTIDETPSCEPAPSDDTPLPGASRPGDGLRVLVADDNPDIADSLAVLLELMGCAVTKARDGLDAVAAAERVRPDLVLLDIGMPRLDGYGACRGIREQPWGKTITIVAISGWDEDRRKSSESGFDRHLVKPVAATALTGLLELTKTPRPPGRRPR